MKYLNPADMWNYEHERRRETKLQTIKIQYEATKWLTEFYKPSSWVSCIDTSSVLRLFAWPRSQDVAAARLAKN